jgi:hypothetical protein
VIHSIDAAAVRVDDTISGFFLRLMPSSARATNSSLLLALRSASASRICRTSHGSASISARRSSLRPTVRVSAVLNCGNEGLSWDSAIAGTQAESARTAAIRGSKRMWFS